MSRTLPGDSHPAEGQHPRDGGEHEQPEGEEDAPTPVWDQRPGDRADDDDDAGEYG